ncbi:MAG: hypothetical protein V7740_14515 [Pseudomonas marincola]
MTNSKNLNPQSFFIATELSIHGHVDFSTAYIEEIRNSRARAARNPYINFLENINNSLSKYNISEQISHGSKLFERLLGFDTLFFEGGSNLIIVFATMYNNFGVSFPVLHSMLLGQGHSILYIKNPDVGMYCSGSPKLGNSIDEMGHALDKFVLDRKFISVSVFGFSSGGYAALFCAATIGADVFIGFGIRTDWSRGSELLFSQGRAAPNDTDYLSNTLVNMRNYRPVDRIKKGILYYGDRDGSDVSHAENMRGKGNFELIPVKNAQHNVITYLVSIGKFEKTLNVRTG